MTKISLIGAGNIGSQIAFYSMLNKLGEVVLVDILKGFPQGKALDIKQGMSFFEDIKLVGSNSYEETKDSDFIVITAGLARKPGMTRDDLKEKNFSIMEKIVPEIVKYSPNSKIIVVTNPMDLVSKKVYELSGFESNRIIGMGGMLDTSRFKLFVSEELNVKSNEVEAFVIGPHNNSMLPLISNCLVNEKKLIELLPKEKIEALVERTKNAGAEMVSLLKTGSAFFAPAICVCKMIEAMESNSREIFSCSTFYEDVYIGLPVVLGKDGVEKIEMPEFLEEEKEEFEKGLRKLEEDY